MLAVLAMLAAWSAASIYTVTVGWDKYPDEVAGFNLYAGTNSRSYHRVVFVPGWTNTSESIDVERNMVYYFAVTATNGGLESAFSDELVFRVPPDAPTVSGHRVVLLIPLVESSVNMVNWRPYEMKPTVVIATNDAEVFRSVGLKIKEELQQ